MAQALSTQLGVASTPEFSQSDYPSIYVDALRIRQALKNLQSILDTYTGALGEEPVYWNQVAPASWNRIANLNRTYAQATETIASGATVNFYNNAGTLGVRNANATAAGKPVHAWATGAVASGAYGEFIVQGVCHLITGLTIGTTYYASNTAGLISATPGTISQKVGYALGTSTFMFRPDLV